MLKSNALMSRLLTLAVTTVLLAGGLPSHAQILNSSPDAARSAQQDTAVRQASEADEPRGILQAGWVSIPKISMPTISWEKIPNPIGPIQSGARKVGEGTRQAWQGTKRLFTFGSGAKSSQQSPVAKKQPSLWQRMIGAEPEPSGPQTVGEWMSQPRLDP